MSRSSRRTLLLMPLLACACVAHRVPLETEGSRDQVSPVEARQMNPEDVIPLVYLVSMTVMGTLMVVGLFKVLHHPH